MKFALLCCVAALTCGVLSACPCGTACDCGPLCLCAAPVSAADCSGPVKTKVKQVLPKVVAVRAVGVRVKKTSAVVSKVRVKR